MDKTAWYSFNIKYVLEKLGTSPEGLSRKDAYLKLQKYGLNELGKEQKRSEVKALFSQFKNPLVYLLIFAAVVTYFLHHNIDTIIILLIVFFNAIIGYMQEKKAEESLKALKKMISQKTIIIRENEKMEISTLELVPGDIVVLEEGIKIPADIRIMDSNNLKVDESALTGESVSMNKRNKTIKFGTDIIGQTNMLFTGTIVVTGMGLGIVVETGKNTELGKIAKEVSSIEEEITPLNIKLLKFSKIILFSTLGLCGVIFILGLFRQIGFVNIFLTAVAAAVSVIPEGLPAIITITLAIGVHRMAKQNAIVRKLSAVETLGSVTVIASDKTGTLTYNQMTMKKIFLDNDLIEITGNGYIPIGKFTKNNSFISIKKSPSLAKTLLMSVLCNNADLVDDENEGWKIVGDPTEGALLVASDKAGIHHDELLKKYPRLDEIPFSPENHFMATLHKDGDKNIIAIKGTLEKILESSTQILKNGKIFRINPQDKEKIIQTAQEQAHRAYRIIAVAYKQIPIAKEKIDHKDIDKLIFCGFACLEDPPRKEAKEAIRKCKEAGIRVIMVTGDFPSTGLAIAQKIGIADNSSKVISGEELKNINDQELKKIVNETAVFARVTPEMKLKIVKALQDNNQIVGVTGDGVNDAPVLKQADVGIAMGKIGTDVARESSDMVLVDDNFVTITNAIEEGRTIFNNIRRSVFFLLSTNMGEALILLMGLLLNLPLPLTAIQILWINLITDGVSGFALAMEPKHEETMKLKPRPVNEGIINTAIVRRIIIVALVMTIGTTILYKWQLSIGASIEKAQTIAFVTMAFFQIFNIINSRSLRFSFIKTRLFNNHYINISFIFMSVLTILTAQSGFFRNLFHTTQLSFNEFYYIFLVAFSVIVFVEIDKFIQRKSQSRT